MLVTFYKDTPHETLLKCLKDVKDLMPSHPNLLGAHLEGPYINCNLGYDDGSKKQLLPEKDVYESYIASGVIKQWTFAPELDGVMPVIKRVSESGIIPALGHSEASYDQVKSAYDNGARIVTHLFDGTGLTDNAKYKGTKDLCFDQACMLMDDMYYEVICDSQWVHVRKQMLDLLIKTVGIDRVVAITDLDTSELLEMNIDLDDGLDIAVVNGQLAGTKLTMNIVCRNLFNAGYSVTDIFKLTAKNPATALGITDRGQIKVGLRADLCLFDKDMNFIKVL
jgi:N-acetylglucosamine-6-phosphate deacetylase